MSPMTQRPPREDRGRVGLRVSAWNVLLLVPLVVLVTPWFNSVDPRLFGLPFFYWYQLAWVPIGVICVAVVYVMTRDRAARESAEEDVR